MHRRRFLAVCSVSVASASGCLFGMPSGAVVRAVPRSSADPAATVEYEALPDAERSIAEAAIESGVYRTCYNVCETMETFANRFSDANADHLRRREEVYGMYIAVRDGVYADGASPPEDDHECPF